MEEEYKKCDKCHKEEFKIKTGGSQCCSWIEYTCIFCGEKENIDTGTGEC